MLLKKLYESLIAECEHYDIKRKIFSIIKKILVRVFDPLKVLVLLN